MDIEPQRSRPFLPWWTMAEDADWSRAFGRRAPLDLEIGFGRGEYLSRESAEHPERDFVGVDVYWAGAGRLVRELMQEGRENVRVLQMDARVCLERLFEPRSLARCWTLFPCPWPKKRSAKHRLHTRDFFRLVNSRLVDGAEFLVVTDWEPYFEWFMEQSQDTGFDVRWEKVPPRRGTRYERKWNDEGTTEFYEVHYTKVRHEDLPRKAAVPMQTHTIPDFDPSVFRPPEIEGRELTVRSKEFLYDAAQRMGMLRVVVAEGALVQHFWVRIAGREDGWRIYPAAGSGFAPTEGVQRAVRLIAEAAAAGGA